MYLSFLAGLYSIAVGRTFSASDHVEMRSVQNALKKLLSEVGEDKETDECIAKKLDQLTSADLRSVTDGLLRTSLHANIKDYLFNMGYPVTGGKEVTFEAVKERRKLDKSVVFLEHCMRRLDYQIVSGAESGSAGVLVLIIMSSFHSPSTFSPSMVVRFPAPSCLSFFHPPS